MENLIDLGKYPRNDVELIAREFLRVVYLDAIDQFVKKDRDGSFGEGEKENMEEALKGLEVSIIVLDGNDEFLKYIHSGGEEEQKEDDEFERF